MTKEQEDEYWRLLGQGMRETLRKDCEAIMVKGYSPLRRWLRQERARENAGYVADPERGLVVMSRKEILAIAEGPSW